MTSPNQETIAAYQSALRQAAAKTTTKDLRISFRSNSRRPGGVIFSTDPDDSVGQCGGPPLGAGSPRL